MLHAQTGPKRVEFHAQKSLDIQKKGMIVLGTWATLNLLSGSTGYFLSGKSGKYFHQMNAVWNTINLGIAGFSYYRILNTDPGTKSYSAILSDAINLDRFLLLNAGLDVGYMATGAWLWERGLRKNSERLTGYGKSLVLQGGFLLIFDLVLYSIHSPVTKNLMQITEDIHITGTGFKVFF